MTYAEEMSITRVPCSCGFFRYPDPVFPIKFDAGLNEYVIEPKLPGGGIVAMILYHCPRCGGIPSGSKRQTLFTVVSVEEVLRIKAVLDEATSLADIEARLGAADEDRTRLPLPDAVENRPVSGVRETGPIRQLTYTHLSETADVTVRIYSNGEIEASFGGKYIGPPIVEESPPGQP